jgi:hypothetical protein
VRARTAPGPARRGAATARDERSARRAPAREAAAVEAEEAAAAEPSIVVEGVEEERRRKRPAAEAHFRIHSEREEESAHTRRRGRAWEREARGAEG